MVSCSRTNAWQCHRRTSSRASPTHGSKSLRLCPASLEAANGKSAGQDADRSHGSAKGTYEEGIEAALDVDLVGLLGHRRDG